MRKTKIICTIGPAAGMNVVRLNMSHGDHESHARVIKAIRTLNRKVRYTVPVMLDTQGPEIRTGHLSAELDLREGQEITIVVRGAEHVEESSIQIDYADIINAVEVGDRITVEPILFASGTHEVNQVFFDGVRVPMSNRVGQEDQGWAVAKYLRR